MAEQKAWMELIAGSAGLASNFLPSPPPPYENAKAAILTIFAAAGAISTAIWWC
ncbi:hypothetical protein KCP70_21800 [Salmonella enterica subsp. enterica]|nr:hypothetical protein KCP70_21800 [Salmonella enterica subsp. enterica]